MKHATTVLQTVGMVLRPPGKKRCPRTSSNHRLHKSSFELTVVRLPKKCVCYSFCLTFSLNHWHETRVQQVRTLSQRASQEQKHTTRWRVKPLEVHHKKIPLLFLLYQVQKSILNNNNHKHPSAPPPTDQKNPHSSPYADSFFKYTANSGDRGEGGALEEHEGETHILLLRRKVGNTVQL